MYIAGCTGSKEIQSVIPVDQKSEETELKSTKQQETSVVIELSREGIALSGQNEAGREVSLWEKMLEQTKQQQKAFSTMLSKTKSTGKKKKKSSGNLAKALAIARRIMRGDKVPPKDESFLFRYNSDLYLKAKTMAMQNQKPKKHKSLLEEMEEGCSICISSPSCSTETGGDPVSDGDSEETEE